MAGKRERPVAPLTFGRPTAEQRFPLADRTLGEFGVELGDALFSIGNARTE